ncbi:peptidoglycan-associated lipoprotein Pal [Limnohabitans sp. Jir72]|uniref:peptidoglycan-associated lipoprotein Pal n=1 Tax=Limnohabitans sp. Jir72 TaxID=1977909 RepID=UPI000D369034|nr:peptidoglycan-associated lipoprotein Pal [Limnohabitans sp. Jir72]
MKKSIWAGLLMVALLSGCASGVRLEDVPVEDKSATSTGASGANSQGIGAGQNGVAGVLSSKSGDGVGPAGVGTVVYFDYDSYVVRAEARPLIETHARFLKSNQQRKASLEGHTDERGGREYNLALGQKRAEAVRQAMTLLGVSDAQIEAVSYGKEKPAAMGSSDADLAKNRRVEIRY